MFKLDGDTSCKPNRMAQLSHKDPGYELGKSVGCVSSVVSSFLHNLWSTEDVASHKSKKLNETKEGGGGGVGVKISIKTTCLCSSISRAPHTVILRNITLNHQTKGCTSISIAFMRFGLPSVATMTINTLRKNYILKCISNINISTKS